MQVIINGFISGLVIALLATGFQLVYLPTRVFFVGLAGLYTFAPYVFLAAWMTTELWYVAVIMSLVFVVALSLVLEWGNHAPLARKSASEGVHLISSLGMYIVMVQIVAMIWSNETQTLQTGLEVIYHFGSVAIPQSQLLVVVVSIVLLVGFLIMLHTTGIGMRLRALSDNPAQFALFGYNIDAHRLIAFGLAGVFVTASSLLTAWDIGFDPHSGLHATLLALVAVIVGGRSSFVGPIIGAILLGLVRTQVVWHLSARWQEAITFTVLALFLLLRPQGLFGVKNSIETGS